MLDAELARVADVERVLGVDERAHAAGALRLGDRVQRQRRLAGRLGAVDLDDAAARQAADAERDVEADRAGRDRRRSRPMSPPDSGMIAPLPNCFSMAAMAPATAFSFSFMLDMGRSLVRSLVGRERGTGGLRRGGRCAIAALPARSAMVRATRRTRRDRARRQAQPLGGAFQQRVSRAVERRDPPQLASTTAARCSAAPRACCRSRAATTRSRTAALDSPGSAWRELAVRQRRHVDVQVDAIEQRPRQPRRGRRSMAAAEQMQVRTALPRWPHGQGFIAAISMKSAG